MPIAVMHRKFQRRGRYRRWQRGTLSLRFFDRSITGNDRSRLSIQDMHVEDRGAISRRLLTVPPVVTSLRANSNDVHLDNELRSWINVARLLCACQLTSADEVKISRSMEFAFSASEIERIDI